MYVIFHLKEKGQDVLNSLMADDEVSRLSISSRDGSKISDEYTGLLVLIEGNDKVVERAVEIVADRGKRLVEDKASEVYGRIKGESENADQGVGFLFGG